MSDAAGEGTDIRLLNKYCTSDIIGIAKESTLKTLANSKTKNFMFMVSMKGFIKRIDIVDIVNAPTSGLVFSKVESGDRLQGVLFGPAKMDLLLYTKNKVLRISPKDVPYLKRSTKGNLVGSNASVINGINFILPHTTDVVVVTKQGYVNRVPIESIELSARRRAGTSILKLTKTDEIHTVWACPSNAILIVREGRSQKDIPIASIPICDINNTGTHMFNDVNKVMLSLRR